MRFLFVLWAFRRPVLFEIINALVGVPSTFGRASKRKSVVALWSFVVMDKKAPSSRVNTVAKQAIPEEEKKR